MSFVKYQNVRQHSEEDCGAASLATIAKHYGRTFTLNRIREAIGTGQLGTSLLGLKQGAEAIGFNTRAGRLTADALAQINRLPLPAIIHWQGNHWVVLYACWRRRYIVADPAVGIRYLSRQELVAGWSNGVMLLLECDPHRFLAQPNDSIGGVERFIKPVWTYRQILGEVIFINLLLGLLSLASPFLVQILTDDILVRGDTQLLRGVAIAVMVMGLVSSSLKLVQSNLIAHFAQRLELSLVLEFCRQILRLPLSYYETRRSGEITSRLRDIQEINQLVAQAVIGIPSQFFIALVSFGFMLFYSYKLTAVASVIVACMSISTVIFWRPLRQKTRSFLALEAENQGILVEIFKGAATLKAMSAAPQFWEELQGRFGRLGNLAYSTIQIGIINQVFSGLVSNTGSISLLWFGSSLVIDKELTIGQLLAFNSMNSNFSAFVGTVIGFMNSFIQVQTAVSRLTEVIDATSESPENVIKLSASISSQADIVCEHLDFHYAGRVNILKDLCITLPGGKVTALIGKSGCGKSTLAKLIAGLYPLQSGNIRIGLYHLQDLSITCLRRQVILVPQEAHFWSRSIIENFRCCLPHVSFEQIIRACQITAADDFISQLPDKYQTVLGEFGANISGGQRQRLALARALACEPSILILDESTAGLNPVAEAEVLNNLLDCRQGKTTILISHRPSVIQRADWIVMLEEGNLKMQGSLEELRSQPGDQLEFLVVNTSSMTENGRYSRSGIRPGLFRSKC